MLLIRFLRRLSPLLLCASPILAQDAASLAGVVIDSSGTVLADARLTLLDSARGTVRTAVSGAGGYFFSSLPPGQYSLEASREGFNTLQLERIRLDARDSRSLMIALQRVSGEPAVVTDSTGIGGISSDLSVGMPANLDDVRHLPLNAREVRSLMLLAPGVADAGSGEQVNANGLRPDANYYTVDGVSARITVADVPEAGVPGGGDPDRIPLETIEQARVQTSAIAPEMGRTAGAQISLVSRSGSNTFHGALYDYIQNDRFSANDWFANRDSLPLGKLRHNNFGANVGGPLARNRTYFFASYEGLRADYPQTVVSSVPDVNLRQTALVKLRPYLNAFPIPNGPQGSDGTSRFSAVTSSRSETDHASLRLDHAISDAVSAFARYSYAAGNGQSRGTGIISPSMLTDADTKTHAVIAVLTLTPSPRTVNDLRAGFSTSTSQSGSVADNFGGAVPLSQSVVFPNGVPSPDASFRINVLGASSYGFGWALRNRQQQLYIADSLTYAAGKHSLKFGLEYRRMAPTIFNPSYQAEATFRGLRSSMGGLRSGTALNAIVVSSEPAVYPLYVNFSMYFGDSWRITPRTTLLYGLRWDLSPAADVRRGQPLISLASAAAFASVTRLNPPYRTRWGEVAPRVGLAYQLDTTPGREMMFRVGFGVFHDVGFGAATGAFSGAPFENRLTLSEPAFPLASSQMAAPSLPATRPYGRVSAAYPLLISPSARQWNITVEKMLSPSQSFSFAYIGSKGNDLLQYETRRSYASSLDEGSPDYDLLRIVLNGAVSDYDAAQLQYRRRLSDGLQAQLSYSFAHSIDTAASSVTDHAGFSTVREDERADSNFDVRHNLSFSGSYSPPAPQQRLLRAAFGDWWLDWMLTARTSPPFDVRGASQVSSDADNDHSDHTSTSGLLALLRADYTGEPLWLDDTSAPGGKRLNPAAFTLAEEFEHGTLGRNSIRGFNVFQVDCAVRREFVLSERLSIHAQAQAYNVLNRPNFMNPTLDDGANLASPAFGLATRMLSQGGGFDSHVRTGGPRSLQFALQLVF